MGMGRTLSALVVALTITAPAATSLAQLTTPGPSGAAAPGTVAGAFETIGRGAKSKPDSTTVSLDAVSSNPARYANQTLARRVSLGNTKPAGDAIAISARDAETGKRVEPEFGSGFSLVMTKGFADKVTGMHKPEAIVTFLVAKLPIPGNEVWIGVVSRVDILGDDGNVVRTISAGE